MKRTLSLILALAMILSCFTTVSFAATEGDGTEGSPYVDAAKFTLKATKTSIVPGSTTTVSADTLNYYHKGESGYTNTAVYTWSTSNPKLTVPAGSNGSSVVVTAASDTPTGPYKVTCTLTVTSTKSGSTTTLHYKDEIDITVGNSVGNTDINLVNGQYGYYTGTQLAGYAAAAIKAATGATTTPTVTAMTITPGTASSGIIFAPSASATTDVTPGTSVAATGTTALLYAKTTPGTIGSRVLSYEASVGTTKYAGTLTFKSGYDTAITVTQAAPFYNEEFDLDPISGIYMLSSTVNAVTSAGATTAYTDWQIAPGTTTKTYTGYTTAGVAKQVTVNFTYPSYDLISYTDDGDTPFDSNYFEAFADNVFAEQHSYNSNLYYSGYVEKISLSNINYLNQYALYLGNTKLTAGTAITPAQLNTVTIDVQKSGTYYIDFVVYYKYTTTSTASSYANATYTGRILVQAGDIGDLTYEVAYGDSVSLNASDFQLLYRTLVGSNAALTYVEIDALPLVGTLYKSNRITNAYLVKADDRLYVNPLSGQDSLSGLVYWASNSYTKEYSVYVPVTMYGTGGFKTATVEIVVQDETIPFTDIPKNHTFYEYISYCYKHDLMNGTSTYKFSASNNLTRGALVTILYRMAGSPTTYNNRTLPFTDTKTLSTEFSNAVKWAYYNKIVGGTSATTFSPTDAITRQAMVKILYGYAKAYGMSTGVEYNNHIGYYTDGGSVSSSMKDAMNWALDYGLLGGNNGKLNPRGSTTRGAAAKILANFHEDFIG